MCDGWAASVVLNVLLGAFGAFFVFKEFGDPTFSDWLSPGAGQALLGDSGRMLMYEAGDDGVQSMLLGAPAWLVEGIVLGVGTLGIFLSPWFSITAQLLCAFAVPVEGVYYLINVVYFPLVAMPEKRRLALLAVAARLGALAAVLRGLGLVHPLRQCVRRVDARARLLEVRLPVALALLEPLALLLLHLPDLAILLGLLGGERLGVLLAPLPLQLRHAVHLLLRPPLQQLSVLLLLETHLVGALPVLVGDEKLHEGADGEVIILLRVPMPAARAREHPTQRVHLLILRPRLASPHHFTDLTVFGDARRAFTYLPLRPTGRPAGRMDLRSSTGRPRARSSAKWGR